MEIPREHLDQEFDSLSLNAKIQEVIDLLQAQGVPTDDLLSSRRSITSVYKEMYPSFVYVDPINEYQRLRNATRDVTRYTITFDEGETKSFTIRASRQGPRL
jgi:hypothetical protein